MYCSKKCNFCPNLVKTRVDGSVDRFDVACGITSYEAFGVTRPRKINCGVGFSDEIYTPQWCPRNKSTEQPKEESHIAYTSYSDRREKMKSLKRMVEWDDIQEGEIYIIPKILNQPRKLVRVISKSDLSCSCHEINENTGNEYSYSMNVYQKDLDAIFLNKIHKF
jgi:hypothetical protein